MLTYCSQYLQTKNCGCNLQVSVVVFCTLVLADIICSPSLTPKPLHVRYYCHRQYYRGLRTDVQQKTSILLRLIKFSASDSGLRVVLNLYKRSDVFIALS